MDTYFRLLRAEIFSGIQRGIHDYKSGTLDYRDMNCYFNVSLAGLCFSKSNLCLALKVGLSRLWWWSDEVMGSIPALTSADDKSQPH